MKRTELLVIIITASLLIFPSRDALSNLYGDFMGVYQDTGDAETQYGFGGLLGLDFSRDISFVAKSLFTEKSKKVDENITNRYIHNMFIGGLGYGYRIPAYRLVWRSSMLLGYSSTEIEVEGYNQNDDGFCFEIATGIQWNATQHISPFIDVGYHQSYYVNELKDASIRGFQTMLGIRIHVFRVKTVDEDY